MKQKQPKFSGILVVAVLMVLVLFIVSLSPLLAASGSKDTTYSEIYYYFENQQVTSFRLDLGTGSLELWLKEGKAALPESNAAASLPTGGLLTGVYSSDDNALPANGGTVYMTYKLPYGGDFNTGKISDFVDEYNAANPDAPMVFDYVAAKTSIPWLEIIFYVAMIGSIGMLFMSMYRGGAGGGIMNVGRAKVKDQQENQRKATFADVAGADEEKAELQEVVEFLKAPNKFNALGARIPHGVLLVGPPGTGKTLLARAVAGEAGVPFFSIAGSEFVEMFVGMGASKVRDLFKQAGEKAPCIVFIDEIDTIGKKRDGGSNLGGNDEREQTLNQLLVEMDGFDNDTNLIIIAATNRPDVLDPALLRPGRFDRQVAVEAPDLEGREAILKVHAKGKPFVPDVDLHMIAVRTPGFTGADLANVLNEAALLCARAGAQLIDNRAIDEAIDRVQAGPKRRSKGMALDELRNTAYHEGGHALVAAAMNDTDPVTKVTILPRGRALGYTAVMPTEDRYSMSRNQLLDQMAYAMGGRTAEEVVFHDPTTGASNDIEKATNIARQMVLDYGFSEKLGAIKWSDDEQSDLGALTHKYSARTAEIIDEEVLKLVETAHTEAWNVINENRDILDELVRQLLVKETLNEKELAAIFANIKKAPKREVWLSDEKRPDSDIPPVPIPDKLKKSAGLTN